MIVVVRKWGPNRRVCLTQINDVCFPSYSRILSTHQTSRRQDDLGYQSRISTPYLFEVITTDRYCYYLEQITT